MLIYYFSRDWSITMWMLTLYVMPFLCYYWLVPESARWLVSTGQVPQARKVLRRIASVNGRTLDHSEKKLYDDLERDARVRPKRYSYIYVLTSLFKSPVMRQRCLIIFYLMMTNLMVYLGIGMGITSLTSDRPYEIFLLSIVTELIGLCLCHFCATKFDRKVPLVLFFTLCSLCILAIPLTHKVLPVTSLCAALCAKLFISAAQALSWIYTSETYPTVIRSTGVGLTMSIARLGGVWAPQISLLAQSVWFPLPYIIFSLCSAVAALFALFLPETRAKLALPDTVKQAEKGDHLAPSFERRLSEVEVENVPSSKKLSICPEEEEDEDDDEELSTAVEEISHSDVDRVERRAGSLGSRRSSKVFFT